MPFSGVTNARIINLSPLFSKINSFGDLGFAAGGPVDRSSVDIMIVFSQAGFCVSYLIFVSNTLVNIFNFTSISTPSNPSILGLPAKTFYIWACFPFQLRLNSIPTLTHLAPLSIFADIVDIGAMGVVMVEEAMIYLKSRPVLQAFGGFFVFFYDIGVAVYAFEGIGMVLPLESETEDKNLVLGVDRYFSSWVIRPVQSQKGDGVLSSCEVILLHSKDMGIPIDVAKLGVSHGMWGTMKKLHGGFRAFQIGRKQDMAIITTKISFEESVYGDQKEEDVTTTARGSGVDWRRVAICEAMAVVFIRMDKLCLPESRFGEAVLFDDQSFTIGCKIQSQVVSSETIYATYLVYKCQKDQSIYEAPMKVDNEELFWGRVVRSIDDSMTRCGHFILQDTLFKYDEFKENVG